MTHITAYDKRGGVAYNFRTPDNLTPEEINKDLRDWGVNPETDRVFINGEEIYAHR
jgi:hypothetical protein